MRLANNRLDAILKKIKEPNFNWETTVDINQKLQSVEIHLHLGLSKNREDLLREDLLSEFRQLNHDILSAALDKLDTNDVFTHRTDNSFRIFVIHATEYADLIPKVRNLAKTPAQKKFIDQELKDIFQLNGMSGRKFY